MCIQEKLFDVVVDANVLYMVAFVAMNKRLPIFIIVTTTKIPSDPEIFLKMSLLFFKMTMPAREIAADDDDATARNAEKKHHFQAMLQ